MHTLKIPRGSSPDIPFDVRETTDGPVMNLTGKPVEVLESTLPFEVVASVVDAPAGRCRLLFPDTAPAVLHKSYHMRLRIGTPGAPGTFATPLFEVMFT